MASLMLTDAVAKDTRHVPVKGYVIVNDGGHPKAITGFGLRITVAGARAWVYRYRYLARTRTFTIGSWPSWNARTARNRAAELARMVDNGVDPQAEKDAARTAPTVGEVCDRYLAEHASRKRTLAEDRRMIESVIKPALGSRKAADIRYSDIAALHRRISTKGTSGSREGGSPYAANRIVTLLHTIFDLAIRWEIRTDNPARGVARNTEHPRERFLSPAELARLSEALAVHPNRAAADAIRLLLLTGSRRAEVLGAHSREFDLEARLWTKPAQNTKQGRVHHVPLEGAVLELVTRLLDAADGGYLFPGRTKPHMTRIRHSWTAACEAADLGAVRLHDLRHSYASILASGGASLLLIGKLLGHSNSSTTSRYSHLLDEPQRAATRAAGDVISGKPPGEVRRLRY